MTGLATIRSRIADDLNRNDINTQIDTAINRAIEHYEKESFWFSEHTASFTTSASQSLYTSADSFPTDIKDIEYVEISVNSSYRYQVTPKTFDEVKSLDSAGTITGYPMFYALFDEEMYLYPAPNGAYGVRVFYQRTFPTLSSDSASNAFTVDAADLIEARASWWLYSRVVKDYEAAAVAKVEELEALKALRIRTENLLQSRRVKPYL